MYPNDPDKIRCLSISLNIPSLCCIISVCAQQVAGHWKTTLRMCSGFCPTFSVMIMSRSSRISMALFFLYPKSQLLHRRVRRMLPRVKIVTRQLKRNRPSLPCHQTTLQPFIFDQRSSQRQRLKMGIDGRKLIKDVAVRVIRI